MTWFMRSALTLACGFVWASSALAQNPTPARNEFLSNLRQIGYEINISTHRTCEISDRIIRSELINRLVPAGLTVDENASPYLYVVVTTLSVNDFVCAAAVRVELLSLQPVATPKGEIRNMTVRVLNLGGVQSGPRGQFAQQTQDVLRNYLDEFLATWREVNAGAEFVRQAPPLNAAPTAAAQGQGSGPSIRTIQQRLQALGHYSGNVDGLLGSGTRAGIQAFQRSQQLPATGETDMETLRRLFP